jgi:hypothetical protein
MFQRDMSVMTNFADPLYLDNLLSSASHPDTLLRWLSKGLGRALLHLQKHDPTPYLPVLERACLKSLQYDAQLEPSRAPYLLKVIDFSQSSDYMINAIIAAYKNGDGVERDRWQLRGLMTRLAANGSEPAKQALFEIASTVGSVAVDGNYADADDLLIIDFNLALVHLHDEYAKLASDEARAEWLDELLEHIQYSDREKLLTDEKLVGRIVGDSDYDLSLVRTVFAKREQDIIEQRSRPKRAIPSYDEMSRQIRNPSSNWSPMSYSRAKSMPKEDLRRLAEDFRDETDPMIIWRYIGAFTRTRCPLGFRRILQFLDTRVERPPRKIGDEQVAVINALAKFRHKTIRNLAHKMADQGDIWAATMLMERNLSQTELPFLEKLTSPEAAMSDDDRHSVAMLTVDITKKVYDKNIVPMIFRVYETSPCSMCRASMVDALIEYDAVPDWIRTEAAFDANVSISNSLEMMSKISA